MGRPKKNKEVLDLSKAKIADGALDNPASVYEIVGRRTSVYNTAKYEDYQKYLRTLNLYDLQSHAYEVGVIPVDNYNVLFDRLERKFLEEISKFISAKNNANTSIKASEPTKTILDILSRGK